MKPHIDILTRRQDDGRVQYLSKFSDGTFMARFNEWPYQGIKITEEQYNRYKLALMPTFEFCQGKLIEFYSEKKLDNGLPEFVNWLF